MDTSTMDCTTQESELLVENMDTNTMDFTNQESELFVKNSAPIQVLIEPIHGRNNQRFHFHHIITTNQSGEKVSVNISLESLDSFISPSIILSNKYLLTNPHLAHCNVIEISSECIKNTTCNVLGLNTVSAFCIHKDPNSRNLKFFHNEFCPKKGENVTFGLNPNEKIILQPLTMTSTTPKVPVINIEILYRQFLSAKTERDSCPYYIHPHYLTDNTKPYPVETLYKIKKIWQEILDGISKVEDENPHLIKLRCMESVLKSAPHLRANLLQLLNTEDSYLIKKIREEILAIVKRINKYNKNQYALDTGISENTDILKECIDLIVSSIKALDETPIKEEIITFPQLAPDIINSKYSKIKCKMLVLLTECFESLPSKDKLDELKSISSEQKSITYYMDNLYEHLIEVNKIIDELEKIINTNIDITKEMKGIDILKENIQTIKNITDSFYYGGHRLGLKDSNATYNYYLKECIEKANCLIFQDYYYPVSLHYQKNRGHLCCIFPQQINTNKKNAYYDCYSDYSDKSRYITSVHRVTAQISLNAPSKFSIGEALRERLISELEAHKAEDEMPIYIPNYPNNIGFLACMNLSDDVLKTEQYQRLLMIYSRKNNPHMNNPTIPLLERSNIILTERCSMNEPTGNNPDCAYVNSDTLLPMSLHITSAKDCIATFGIPLNNITSNHGMLTTEQNL